MKISLKMIFFCIFVLIQTKLAQLNLKDSLKSLLSLLYIGAPVAQLVKRWPTDLADRVRSSLGVKSSQP